MLAEKLEHLITLVINNYDMCKIGNLLGLATRALYARDQGQDDVYKNSVTEINNAITTVLSALDRRLDTKAVIDLFNDSAFGSITLPRSLLVTLRGMLTTDMAAAASSSEVRMLTAAHNTTRASLTNALTTLRALGLADQQEPANTIRFRLTFPEGVSTSTLSGLSEKASQIDMLTVVSSEYYTGHPAEVILSHFSGSNTIFYLDLVKDYAPVFISIWNTCLSSAAKMIEISKAVNDLRRARLDEKLIAEARNGLERDAREVMIKSLDVIGKAMVDEHRATEIKGRLATTVSRTAEAASRGMTVSIETEFDVTWKSEPLRNSAANDSKEESDQPTFAQLLERTMALQNGLNYLSRSLAAARELEASPPKQIEHRPENSADPGDIDK